MGNNSSAPTYTGASHTPSTHPSPYFHRKEASGSSSRDKIKTDGHGLISGHATQRSGAPPEPSLAQAHGSTVINRPKSLPATALSSLNNSPHSHIPPAPSKPTDVAPAGRYSHVLPEPSKPVDVPFESSPFHSQSTTHISQSDSQLIPNNSMTEMFTSRPPRLPLPIEEEVHTPGSPILAPTEGEGLPDVDPNESSDALTRKSSALSAGTAEDEETEELRVDKTRPVVPVKLEWLRGGEKVYVTGTIFQWNRKQRLHPA